MKKSLGEIMSDPRIWEMSEEEKQRGRQRIMEIAKREMESGMLTYKDEEPVMVHAPIIQGIRIMAGDKLVGFAKEGMLTCHTEDDGSTKDSGAWERPMRHSYEIKGEAVVSEVGGTIRELLEDVPRKVDVEIRREMGKMPRKMKKAYRTGSCYRRDTKWKRKAKAYERRFVYYRLPDAEIVVTRQQMGVLEATIKGGI